MSKWKSTKLGSLGDFKTGGTPTRTRPEYFDGEIPWITTTSLRKLLIDESDAVEYISMEAIENSSTKLILPNSIMVGIRVGVGKVSINSVPMCTSQDIISIENINEEIVYKPFLVYCIKNYENFFSSHKRGATIQGISSAILKSIDIPLPPLETQKQIAKKLDTVAELLAMRKQQLVELDNLIKSTFHDMFGDPITNEKGWKVAALGELCDITSSKRIFESEYVSEGIPFFRTKEIVELSRGNNISTELFISTERYNEIRTKFEVPSRNDILISAVGTIGTMWIVPDEQPFYFKDGNLLWIKSTSKFNSIYLKNLLSVLVNHYISSLTIGSAYNALTIVKLKQMLALIPPIEMQNQFATIVNKIEEQKKLVKKAIDETQYLFDKLMAQYFD